MKNYNQLEQSPLHLLHRARQCAQDLFQVHMADIDITPRQYAVLLAASLREGACQRELIEITGIDRSTLSQIMLQLLKKDFLARCRVKADARTYAVTLTNKGRDVLAMSQPIMARIDKDLLAVLPPGRGQRFLESLAVVANMVGAGTG